MNSKQKNDVLVKLVNLNFQIQEKEKDIDGARKFNRTALLNNKYNISKVVLELQELELNWNKEKRNL